MAGWFVRRGVAALCVAVLGAAGALASSASADEVGPPGLAGRQTHLTSLTTVESDCYEVTFGRAGRVDAVRVVVPERYTPGVFSTGLGFPVAGLRVWDYTCRELSVDTQRRDRETHVSLYAAALTQRDGQPVTGSYYLLGLSTDDPVLAARYRQVGLPAELLPDVAWSVTAPGETPYVVAFSVPGVDEHQVRAQAAAAPQPTPASGGPTFFYDGDAGEVAMTYANQEIGSASSTMTFDLTRDMGIVAVIALPSLVSGTVAGPTYRGDWTAAVTRTS